MSNTPLFRELLLLLLPRPQLQHNNHPATRGCLTRNCPKDIRKTVLFSYDWLHTVELACWRSKQLVPSGWGLNRT